MPAAYSMFMNGSPVPADAMGEPSQILAKYAPGNRLNSLDLQESHLYEASDKFTIWEEELPSGGYKWIVKIDPEGKCGGKKAIKILKSECKEEHTDKPRFGAPCKRQWKFKVTKKAHEGSECNIHFL